MFKRVISENWTEWAPYVGFWITFVVFLVLVIRAVRMKKSKREHAKNLPLEGDQPVESNHDNRPPE